MDLIREKVFVNRYHYDVRNHEWEKENGVPKTNVEVTFQLHNKDEEAKWTIFKTVSSMNQKTSHKKKQKPWLHRSWIRFNV